MDQGLSERQWRFLKAAQQFAGAANRFRWREVGASLGLGDQESRQIAEELERRVAIVLPTEIEGQILPLGRMLIQNWPPAGPATASERVHQKAAKAASPTTSRHKAKLGPGEKRKSVDPTRVSRKHGAGADKNR